MIEGGEYVRTKEGCIAKCVEVDEDGDYFTFDNCVEEQYGDKFFSLYDNELNKITKHSKNIIDLIEVGDYVNGKEVIMGLQKSKEWYKSKDNFITCKDYTFEEKEIKSIVTSQQFKNIEYIVED